ncbi:hypothetical protein D3C72_2033000 [compost metagenome]
MPAHYRQHPRGNTLEFVDLLPAHAAGARQGNGDRQFRPERHDVVELVFKTRMLVERQIIFATLEVVRCDIAQPVTAWRDALHTGPVERAQQVEALKVFAHIAFWHPWPLLVALEQCRRQAFMRKQEHGDGMGGRQGVERCEQRLDKP